MFISSIRLLYPNYSMGASLFEGGAAAKFLVNTKSCTVHVKFTYCPETDVS